MPCSHHWITSDQHQYLQCRHCYTYMSTAAPDPEEIYSLEYWSEKFGHSTIRDQVHNVDVHEEGGLTKNQFVLNLIDVPAKDAAIEIGCAPDRLLRRLEDYGFGEVVGVEASYRYEQDLREIGPFHGRLIFGYFPMSTGCIPDGSYDLLVALDLFEHSHEPECFVRECARLVRPGGQVILMAPIYILGEEMLERMFHPREHVFLHSLSHAVMLLKDAGFEHVKQTRWTSGHEVLTARRAVREGG